MPASPSPSYPWRSPSSKMMSRSSRNCPADEKMASSSPSAPRIAAAASGPGSVSPRPSSSFLGETPSWKIQELGSAGPGFGGADGGAEGELDAIFSSAGQFLDDLDIIFEEGERQGYEGE